MSCKIVKNGGISSGQGTIALDSLRVSNWMQCPVKLRQNTFGIESVSRFIENHTAIADVPLTISQDIAENCHIRDKIRMASYNTDRN